MGTIVVILILVVIAAIALRGALKYFKGEGGCCGGGDSVSEPKKELEGEIIATKVVSIEGMHCENCKNSIEHQINRIDGAACQVNLKKKTATITMTRPISDYEITRDIERLDFKVVKIENKE